MAHKKARLNDTNNPLSPTEQVLAGLEQVSQSTRISHHSSVSSERVSQAISNNLSASQPVNNLDAQQANLLAVRFAEQPNSQNPNQSNSHQVKQLASQKVEVRKATFKIDSRILDELDTYHLRLQLQLGKRNAPYKETIVELALKNILAEIKSNPEKLLEHLHQQQERRE
jgi:hypothetical protein